MVARRIAGNISYKEHYPLPTQLDSDRSRRWCSRDLVAPRGINDSLIQSANRQGQTTTLPVPDGRFLAVLGDASGTRLLTHVRNAQNSQLWQIDSKPPVGLFAQLFGRASLAATQIRTNLPGSAL